MGTSAIAVTAANKILSKGRSFLTRQTIATEGEYLRESLLPNSARVTRPAPPEIDDRMAVSQELPRPATSSSSSLTSSSLPPRPKATAGFRDLNIKREGASINTFEGLLYSLEVGADSLCDELDLFLENTERIRKRIEAEISNSKKEKGGLAGKRTAIEMDLRAILEAAAANNNADII
jgi:hypothetical protein